MQEIAKDQLGGVHGGKESFGDVMRALRSSPDVPVAQTYQQTLDFIAQHSFFHQGLMNAPIGGGKHFRNVPFVGPSRMIKGAVTGNGDELRRGLAVTRAWSCDFTRSMSGARVASAWEQTPRLEHATRSPLAPPRNRS